MCIQEEVSQRSAGGVVTTSGPIAVPGSGAAAGGGVNKAIQQLAQRYCNECHHVFDELSKIIQVCDDCARTYISIDRLIDN